MHKVCLYLHWFFLTKFFIRHCDIRRGSGGWVVDDGLGTPAQTIYFHRFLLFHRFPPELTLVMFMNLSSWWDSSLPTYSSPLGQSGRPPAQEKHLPDFLGQPSLGRCWVSRIPQVGRLTRLTRLTLLTLLPPPPSWLLETFLLRGTFLEVQEHFYPENMNMWVKEANCFVNTQLELWKTLRFVVDGLHV